MGQLEIREFFAWWPVIIDGETRWLEKVKVEGHYWKGNLMINWANHKFVD